MERRDNGLFVFRREHLLKGLPLLIEKINLAQEGVHQQTKNQKELKRTQMSLGGIQI